MSSFRYLFSLFSICILSSYVFGFRVSKFDGQTGCNVYLIQEGNLVVLVDAGSNSDADGIIQFLINQNIQSLGGLDLIFITHGHPDHFGGLPKIMNEFPTTPIVSTQQIKNELIASASEVGDTYDYLDEVQVRPTSGVLNALGLRVFSGFVAGESVGSSILFSSSQNVAFVGDLLFVKSHMFLGSDIDRSRVRGWRDVNLSLLRNDLLSFNDRTVLFPGYGPNGDLSVIRENQQYLTFFLQTLLTCSSSTGSFPTLPEVSQKLIAQFPSYQNEFLLRFMETNRAWSEAQRNQLNCQTTYIPSYLDFETSQSNPDSGDERIRANGWIMIIGLLITVMVIGSG